MRGKQGNRTGDRLKATFRQLFYSKSLKFYLLFMIFINSGEKVKILKY